MDHFHFSNPHPSVAAALAGWRGRVTFRKVWQITRVIPNGKICQGLQRCHSTIELRQRHTSITSNHCWKGTPAAFSLMSGPLVLRARPTTSCREHPAPRESPSISEGKIERLGRRCDWRLLHRRSCDRGNSSALLRSPFPGERPGDVGSRHTPSLVSWARSPGTSH